MSKTGRSIVNAQGFFLKHETETETQEDIQAHVAEKMDIVDDFLVGRKRLKGKERYALEEHLCSLGSIRAVDVYFRNFINARI